MACHASCFGWCFRSEAAESESRCGTRRAKCRRGSSLTLGEEVRDRAIDDFRPLGTLSTMKGKFTAIIEEAPEGGYWAISPEMPGANGQGETVAEAKTSLREAIRLIFEDRVEDARRGLPEDAIQTVVAV